MFIIVGVAVLAVAGVLIAGYVIQFVLPPREVIIKVGETAYTRGDLVKTLRVQQRGAEFFGLEFTAGTEIFASLQRMIEDEIMTQEAPKFGITVSREEIDRQVEFTFLASAAPGSDPRQLERDFDERYRQYLNAVGLNEEEHREITRRSILRAKFREFIGEQVPAVAEQVHYYQVVMDIGDEIDIMQTKARDALRSASTPEERASVFFDIVREFSRDDAETVRLGGDKGWVPMGTDFSYETTVFGLELGALSNPVTDQANPRNVIFFMVSERAEARQLDPDDREQLKTRALQDWINEQRTNHEVFANFNSDIYSWLIKQLHITGVASPTPTQSILQIPGA